jgi:hypothetical protein
VISSVDAEEAGEIGEAELEKGEREQHRDAGDQHRFAEELGDELAALGAEHLAQRHFAGALAGAGGGEVDEVDRGHAEDQEGDDREGDDGAPVVARPLGIAFRAAQVDVGHGDEAPVEQVAFAHPLPGDVARRNAAPLPLLSRSLIDSPSAPGRSFR